MVKIIDPRVVSKWIDGRTPKEINEVLTKLINGEYTVDQLKQDLEEWAEDQSTGEVPI